MFWLIFILVSVLLWSVLFHELGHYITFRFAGYKYVDIVFKYKVSPYFKGHLLAVGDNVDYTSLSRLLIVGIYINGILAGVLPLLLLAGVGWPFFIIALFIYGVGCIPDTKNLILVVFDENFNKKQKKG